MKIKALAVLAVAGALLVGAGCVATQDGRTSAGVPFVKDQFVSRYERPLPVVVAAAREVLNRNGRMTADNTIGNTLNAKVAKRDVFVRCSEVDQRVTQIVIQIRTAYGGTDLDLARELDKQIAIQLTTMPVR